MPYEFTFSRRIEFAETDLAGIVHFSNFYRMMEMTEHAFFRSLGFSIQQDFEGVHIGWPRVAAACEFFKPLRFEETVEIQLLVAEIRSRSIRYAFRFWKQGGDPRIEAARGTVTTVCAAIDRAQGKIAAQPLPPALVSVLQVAPPELLTVFPTAPARLARPCPGWGRNQPTVMSNPPKKSMTWLLFSFLTVLCWGVYGVYLYKGQTEMNDLANGRWKAFLFVGFAYFLVAVIAPLVMLRLNGASTNFFSYPGPGKGWALVAGIVGAVGAFGVLLAFGAAPNPKSAYIPVVMSIIFAGAPIVNAFASIYYRPPGSHVEIQWPFWLGISLAAVGGSLVSFYKPEAILPPKTVVMPAPGGTPAVSVPAPATH